MLSLKMSIDVPAVNTIVPLLGVELLVYRPTVVLGNQTLDFIPELIKEESHFYFLIYKCSQWHFRYSLLFYFLTQSQTWNEIWSYQICHPANVALTQTCHHPGEKHTLYSMIPLLNAYLLIPSRHFILTPNPFSDYFLS